ncbi:MAG: polyprenyl synthetase family protein [candidate division KSB1 bacterium]|nr:polyprenyl synthetase family protein [candidate division KSB1 bacterium]
MTRHAFCQPIAAELDLFEKEFGAALASDVGLINDVAVHLVMHRGKRLRPILVLLACGLHGAAPRKALTKAVAVELLHTATLVHDDVVDASLLRRGAPTVNGLWSNRISILMGDLLFSRALALLLEGEDLRALRLISEATFRMSRGELLQEEHGTDARLTEENYFRIVSDKTAALLSACCRLGALAAGGDEPQLEAMARFGEHLGVAFQIRDDVLDYVGDEATLGKPIGSDILNNKVTLPLIHALRSAAPEEAEEVLAHLNSGDRGRVEAVLAFVKRHGGLEYADQQADRYLSAARSTLEEYPDTPYKRALMELLEYVGRRRK